MDANESPVRALVVATNDETVLQAVSSTLGKAGFAVAGASSVQAALHLCRNADPTPELAIIDATAPGIDISEFVFQLHQVAPGVRVLFLTGESQNLEHLRSLRVQWKARLLSKPFRRSQLLGQVLSLMDEPMVLTA